MVKILIVDDSIIVRKDLKRIVKKAGYEIAGEAIDGYEGFEKYKEHNPDLVLLDITMPNCNGLESLKLIRDFDNKAKVIMVTAMEKKLAVVESMKLGALDYIIKPFVEERVINSIKRGLSI